MTLGNAAASHRSSHRSSYNKVNRGSQLNQIQQTKRNIGGPAALILNSEGTSISNNIQSPVDMGQLSVKHHLINNNQVVQVVTSVASQNSNHNNSSAGSWREQNLAI